jgi:hypothetical protein
LRFEENVKPFGVRSKLSQDYSYNVAKVWSRPLDFLFIDGDHNFDAVMQDFDQWTPHLKTGGLLAVHDCRMFRAGGANFHPGPSRMAMTRIFDRPQKWKVIGEAISLVIAERR